MRPSGDPVDIVVIGSGIVGVACAYYLSRGGARVTVLDRDEVGRGCSYGNAGLVVPSYSVPIATPTALRHGLRWLFNREAPLAIRPRADLAMVAWLVRFVAACRWRKARATARILRELATMSAGLYAQLRPSMDGDVGYQCRGWLYLCRTEAGLVEQRRQAELVRGAGVRSEFVGAAGARALEPRTGDTVIGGVYYPDDADLRPYEAVRSLARLAIDRGASFRAGVEVDGFDIHGGRIESVLTSAGPIRAGTVVLAAGAWSSPLARRLGLRLPVEPARGYSITTPAPARQPSRPLMLSEAHVVVTPMGGGVRTTGALELRGFGSAPDLRRLSAIRRAPGEYLDLREAGDRGVRDEEIWSGYRPLTPDGLPVIGPARRPRNLIFATGHGALGMTLGPVTGKLVADLVLGQAPGISLDPILPGRFGL